MAARDAAQLTLGSHAGQDKDKPGADDKAGTTNAGAARATKRQAARPGKPMIDDALWERIEPLLPAAKPRRFQYPGRKPVTDRQALGGILFVLVNRIRWNELPAELGCGSGISCWRRLRTWQESGVWDVVQAVLNTHSPLAGQIDFSRAAAELPRTGGEARKPKRATPPRRALTAAKKAAPKAATPQRSRRTTTS
jgi:transposase